MDLKKLVKRSALLGIGLASISKDRARKLLKEAEKKGKVSSDDARKLYTKLSKEADRQKREFELLVKKEIMSAVSRVGIATKADLARLKKRPVKKRTVKKKKASKRTKKKSVKRRSSKK